VHYGTLWLFILCVVYYVMHSHEMKTGRSS